MDKKGRFWNKLNLEEQIRFRDFLGELLETGQLKVEIGKLQELWEKFKDKQK